MKPRTKGKRISVVSGVILLTVLTITTWFFWDHIQFWWLFESLGKNEQGYPEYRHRQTGIVMVRLPGGTSLIGYDGASGWFHADAVPQHEATLDAFLLDKYELSQSEWTKVMTSNRSKNTGDSHPVDGLSYDDCQSFCSKTGLALPTEAQWEYACRAGTTSVYYFGHFYEQAAASGRNPVCESGSERGVLRGGDCLLESLSFCTSSVRQSWSKTSSYAAEGHGFRPTYYPLP